MIIEATLSKDQFIRLSILQHIQRGRFYFYALTCAGVTAYVIFLGGPNLFLLVAWIPFILYLALGILSAFQDSAAKNNPHLQPIRYRFSSKGVSISSDPNKSNLEWKHFTTWQTVAACYVLTLTDGAILAIPTAALSTEQKPKFEAMLDEYILKG